MMNAKRHAIIKTATLMEEIVMNVTLVAIIIWLRMMIVKSHAIIKTANLMEAIVINFPMVAICT